MKDSGQTDFRRERRAGMTYIFLSAPIALAVWLAIDKGMTPLAGMDAPLPRLIFALKCLSLAVLFCLVTGVEAIAHERLTSPAFDPLVGFHTRRLRINQRYLENTLEQTVVFAVGLMGLSVYCTDGIAMRAVVATTVVWILARFVFWIGYHHSAAARSLGAPGMALAMLVLLYVAARFGQELAGTAGAVLPVAAFLVIEAVLFWTTTRPDSTAE